MLSRMLMRTVLLGLLPATAWAANSVVVQSKAVPRGAHGVTVGIYVANEIPVQGFVLPMEVRSVTPGAYIADTFSLETENRLDSFLIGMAVIGYLPSPDNTLPWKCQGRGYGTRGPIDFISPDGVLYGAVRTSDSCLPIGNDGAPPGGSPSLKMTFNVTGVDGTFEIDTTCITWNNHILFVDCTDLQTTTTVMPSFTKGVITIGCACDCHGDPVCDHIHNIMDLNKTIGVAFRGAPPVIDPNPLCPYTDTDVNCDGVTTVIDVGKMRNVVFMGANPNTEFCNPCP